MMISYLKFALYFFLASTLTSCLIFQKPDIKVSSEDTLIINGVLGKRFHKKFSATLEAHPNIKNVTMIDVPGSINDEWNAKTCRLLHEKGLNTHLTSNSIIASGGVDLFISGIQRTIDDGAKIGVHSWSDGKKDGIDYPKDSEEYQLLLNLYQDINIDSSFYWYTLRAAPAKDIHWMSKEEIDFYKLKKD